MKKAKFLIRVKKGEYQPVQGYILEVNGFWIGIDRRARRSWYVTELRSGMGCGQTETLKQAEEQARSVRLWGVLNQIRETDQDKWKGLWEATEKAYCESNDAELAKTFWRLWEEK